MRRLLVTLISGALLAMTASPAFATQWVQFRYDAGQSGVNPDETSITVDNADTWHADWEVYPTFTRRYTTAPIVTEDAVFVGGSKIGSDGLPRAAVWSFDVATGAVNWVRPLSCSTVAAPSMGLSQGMVIAPLAGCGPSQPGRLAFVNASAGTHAGTVKSFDGGLGAPAIYQDTVVLNDGGDIVVVDVATRTIVDRFFISESFGGRGSQPWSVVDGNVYNPETSGQIPAVSSGIIVSPTHQLRLHSLLDGSFEWFECSNDSNQRIACAVDRVTHDVLWTKPTSELLSLMLVVEDVLYHVCEFPSQSGVPAFSLCAFDLATGTLLWNGEQVALEALGRSSGWAPIYVNGVVFVGGFDLGSVEPQMVGFDADTGEVVSPRIDGTPWGDFYTPGGKFMAIANGLLVTTVPAVRVTSFG